MTRTTITLPEELAAALRREARRRGVSVSHVAREAIENRLGRDKGRHRFSFVALGRSGYHNTARDFEEILAAEWNVDRGR